MVEVCWLVSHLNVFYIPLTVCYHFSFLLLISPPNYTLTLVCVSQKLFDSSDQMYKLFLISPWAYIFGQGCQTWNTLSPECESVYLVTSKIWLNAWPNCPWLTWDSTSNMLMGLYTRECIEYVWSKHQLSFWYLWTSFRLNPKGCCERRGRIFDTSARNLSGSD